MAWTIYTKNGSERKVQWLQGEATDNGIVVTSGSVMRSAKTWVKPELEYTGEWMGETFVTLTIHCAVPINFEIGDYIIYRGEKFVMNYDPTVVKKARRGTYGEGFVYENVKFNSLGVELTDCRMLDYVLDDNKIHYSSLPKFSFFCNDVNDLADRLQANTDRYCAANNFEYGDYWIFITPDYDRTIDRCGGDSTREGVADYLYEKYYGTNGYQFADSEAKLNQNISVDNMSVWDACRYIKEACGYNFIIRDRAVVVGAIGHTTQEFGYGKGNGLYEIERTADSEQQIITKLYAYGSDKNLPLHYYANLNKVCYAVVNTAFSPYTIIDVPFGSTYFTTMVNLNGTIAASVQFTYNGQTYNAYVRDTSIMPTPLTESSILFSDHALPSFQGSEHIVFTSGINKDVWLHVEGSSSLPNNMAIDRLMLPGFPEMSLYAWVKAHGATNTEDGTGLATWHNHTAYFSLDKDQPYILSLNHADLGIREGTKYFDGSDGTEEIYPTIKNAPNNVDIIAHAEVIEDNGLYADGDTPPTFHITLPDFGNEFNLKSLKTDETKIEVTDGYCGGRDFNVISVERNDNDGTWDCECDRHQDTDLHLYFPYKHYDDSGWETMPYQLRGSDTPNYDGDHYVLTGIEMTSTYIEWGAEKLLEAALNFLESNDYTRYTYLPKIDEIYMARDYDRYGSGSCYWTLKEGDLLSFSDSDLSIGGSVYIDTLRIKEYGNGHIPTFEVTLRNDKLVGSIQRMQEQINSLATGGGGSGSGFGGGAATSSAVIATIQTEGAKYFLSKTKDDTANGLITFMQGLVSKAVSAFDAGVTILGNALNRIIRHNDSITADGVGSDDAVLSERKALETLLRKDKAETLTYLLTMAGGARTASLESLSFETGDEGHGFSIKEIGGHYTLEIDDIIARRRFQVNVLDVKRTMFSQGRQVLTEANGTVNIVRPLDEDGNDMGVTIVAVNVSGNNYVTFAVNDTVIGETEGKTIDFTDAWAYKIYTLAEDDEKTVFDFWRVGDMAMCKELNVETREDGTSYEETDEDSSLYGETVANHQWHRLVLDHGTETLADGRKYNYVVVSNAHMSGDASTPVKISIPVLSSQPESETYPKKNGYYAKDGEILSAWSFDGTLANTVPMVGDDYVQYGSVLDTSRQGVTSLSQDAKGGVLSHIKNIGSDIKAASSDPTLSKQRSTYQFTSGDKTLNLGDKVIMKADEFYMSTQTSASTTTYKSVVPYMGTWISGTSVGYANQEWSFNGSKYVCNVDGTTADPPSANWTLSVSKGDTGAQGPQGPSGDDSWVVQVSPSVITIGETIVSSNNDLVVNYYSCVADIKLMHGEDDETSLLTLQKITPQGTYYADYSIDSVNTHRISVFLSHPDGQTNKNVTATSIPINCRYNGEDHTVNIPVAINRAGTYSMRVLGDVRQDISTKTATIWDETTGTAKDVAYQSDITQAADLINLNVARVERGLELTDENVANLQLTADSLTAKVEGSTTTELLYRMSGSTRIANPITSKTTSQEATTIIRIQSENVSVHTFNYSAYADLVQGEQYQLTFIGEFTASESGGVIILRLSNSEESYERLFTIYNNITPNVLSRIDEIVSDFTGTVNVELFYQYSSNTSSKKASVSWLKLEHMGTKSMSSLEMESDKISLSVSGVASSGENILKQTDWRGKTITQITSWTRKVGNTVVTAANHPYFSLIPNAYGEFTSYHIVRPTETSDTTQILQSLSDRISTNTQYTLSFYYRSMGTPWLYVNGFFSGSAITINGVSYERNGVEKNGFSYSGNIQMPSTSWAWKRVEVTFTTGSSFSDPTFAFQLYSSSPSYYIEAEFVLPKLEKGATATTWSDLSETLAKSGIDIYANKIIAKTNNFEIQNQSDTKTFGIDADGNLETIGNASFKGNVEATNFIATGGGFVAKNGNNETVFEIDNNGNGYMAGVVRASILYTQHNRIDIRSNYTDSQLGSLPNKLIIYSTSNDVGDDGKALAYSVTLPSASEYAGHELEIFCQVPMYYVTLGPTNHYYPVITIKTKNNEGFLDAMAPIYDDTTTITKIIPTAASGNVTNYLLYPASDYDHMFSIRLLSWGVYSGVYRWMILSRKDASIVREQLT